MEEERPFSPESAFGGTLLRIATLAAVISIVFFFVFKNDVNRNNGIPAHLEAGKETPKSHDNPILPLRKASSMNYDILEKGFQPNISEEVNSFQIEIGKEFKNSITLHLTGIQEDIQEQVVNLKLLLKDLSLDTEYKPGNNSPVYSIKGLSGNVLAELIEGLREIDGKLELDSLIKELMFNENGKTIALDPSSLIDIHLILKITTSFKQD